MTFSQVSRNTRSDSVTEKFELRGACGITMLLLLAQTNRPKSLKLEVRSTDQYSAKVLWITIYVMALKQMFESLTARTLFENRDRSPVAIPLSVKQLQKQPRRSPELNP